MVSWKGSCGKHIEECTKVEDVLSWVEGVCEESPSVSWSVSVPNPDRFLKKGLLKGLQICDESERVLNSIALVDRFPNDSSSSAHAPHKCAVWKKVAFKV